MRRYFLNSSHTYDKFILLVNHGVIEHSWFALFRDFNLSFFPSQFGASDDLKHLEQVREHHAILIFTVKQRIQIFELGVVLVVLLHFGR